MALYPSATFKYFDQPAPMHSILEDFDDLFSEALFHPFHDLHAGQRPARRRAPHHRCFATAVRLSDFLADQVAVKVEDRRVRVHAKQQDGDDVSEVKKTVLLPEDVDADKVETTFTKEGFLVIRAPYICPAKPGQAADPLLTGDLPENWQSLRKLMRGPGITDPKEHLLLDEAGNTRFHVTIPVRDYHPDEISVKQVGDKISIVAEHKEEREGQLVQRSMRRELLLPQGVSREHLISRLTPQGELSIEAPAPGLALPEARQVPVEK